MSLRGGRHHEARRHREPGGGEAPQVGRLRPEKATESRIAASDKATTSECLRPRHIYVFRTHGYLLSASEAALRSASSPVEPYGDEFTRMGLALLVPLGIGQVAAGEEEDDQRRDEHRRRRLERQILPELSGLDAGCEVAGE